MADEPLKMRATVVDNATATLRKIRNALVDVARPDTMAGFSRQVKNVRTETGALGREVSTVLTPALARFGLGAGGFAAAMTMLAKQSRDFSREIVDLGRQAKSLGLTTKSFEAFTHAAAKMRISPDAVSDGLASFRRNAEDFQMRIGELRSELRRLGAGDVVNAIENAKSPIDQLRIAFARMEEIQKRSPAAAKRFAEAMFGSAKFARMSWKEVEAAFSEVNSPTEEQLKLSREVHEAWVTLERRATELSRAINFAMLPGFKDLAKTLSDIDTKDLETLGSAMGGVVAAGARDAAKFVRELSDTVRSFMAIMHAYEKGGLSGVFGEIGKQSGPIIDRNSTYEGLKEGGAVPLSGAIAEQQRRADEVRKRIGNMDTALGRLPADSGARIRLEEARQKEIEALQKMEENIRNLNKELEDANGALRQGRHGWGGGQFVPTAYNPGGGGPAGGPARGSGRGWGGGGYKVLPDSADSPASSPAGRKAAAAMNGPTIKGGTQQDIAMKAAMDQLRKEGVPEANLEYAAASLVGQAIVESGINPRARHDYDRRQGRYTGYGIYGARDPTPGKGRATDMLRWMAKNGFEKDSTEGQMREMAHSAMNNPRFRPSRNALMNATNENMHGVAGVLTRNFEAPADQGPRQIGNRHNASRGAHQRWRSLPAGMRALPIDQANNPALKAEGTVKVDVHAPQGTRVSAESEGIFQNTELRRHRQMEPATLGPMDVQ